ncbi:putative DNA-directed RNA polymerase [Bienertia sinuspersici]
MMINAYYTQLIMRSSFVEIGELTVFQHLSELFFPLFSITVLLISSIFHNIAFKF